MVNLQTAHRRVVRGTLGDQIGVGGRRFQCSFMRLWLERVLEAHGGLPRESVHQNYQLLGSLQVELAQSTSIYLDFVKAASVFSIPLLTSPYVVSLPLYCSVVVL